MELYNLIRIFGQVFVLARFRSSAAYNNEEALHNAFDLVRFKQTKARRVFKALCQLIYISLVYYGMTEYELNAEQANIALYGSIGAFFTLFHAEIKIGVSRNTESRVETINSDLSSGATEWFHIPWPLAVLIPMVSWFQVRPVQASMGVCGVCFFIFGLIKYL